MKKVNLTFIILAITGLFMLSACGGNSRTADGNETVGEPTGWHSVDPLDLEVRPVAMFEKDWVAVAAGNEEDFNALTASWGMIGELWSRPAVTVYISTDRYTFEFMERNEYFTVTAFTEDYREALRYLGTNSGRDGDKIAAAGLTPIFTESGNPIFEESKMYIECRKIYSQQFIHDLLDDKAQAFYSRGTGIHHMYIGEIIDIKVKR